MNKENVPFDLEIFGQRVKLSPHSAKEQATAREAAEIVKQQALKLKEKSPQLSIEQIYLLIALEMASNEIRLKEEYRINIQQLRSSAEEALHVIEEIKAQ